MGAASLATLWGEFLCVQLQGQVRVAVAALLALAFFWHAGVLLVDPSFAPFVVFALVVASGGLYLFLHATFAPMDDMPLVDAKESDARLQITWKPSLLTVMGSLAQGFALYWLVQPQVLVLPTSFLAEALSLVVVVLLLVDSLRSFVMKESFIRRLFLPVLGACILTLLFLPADLRVWPCMLAFGFSLLPYASAIFATCEHIVRCRLSALRTSAGARLYAAIGLVVGLLTGWLAFSSDVFGDVTLQAWVVVVVMFFILVSTTLSTKSYYPGEDAPSAPAGAVRVGVMGQAVPDREQAPAIDKKQCFQQRCDAVAGHFGLTNRQTEVLHLLAKGRNAAYIQKQLVISQHTAKAHIYSIYKKTGTHSQQDLMDLVESWEGEGKR